jgi:hypothetical protein
MDYNKLYSDVKEAYEALQEENVGVLMGSKEYKETLKSYEDVLTSLDKIQKKVEADPQYTVTDHELEDVSNKLENASEKTENYIDKKNAEAEKSNLSATSQYRLEAATDGKEVIDDAIEKWGDLAAERGKERPVPADEKVKSERIKASKGLEAAEEGVHMGSSEYAAVKTEASKLDRKWDDITKNKKDYIPTPGEIADLKSNIRAAREKADAYLSTKDGKTKVADKTERRINAVDRFKESLDMQEKKLADWEKVNESKQADRNHALMYEDTSVVRKQAEAADEGVVRGSAEYREVKGLLRKKEEKLLIIKEKGKSYRMTADDIKELEDLNDRLDKASDKYFDKKSKELELSPKTRSRIRVMQKVKNDVAATKISLKKRKDELEKEAEAVKEEEITKETKDISKEIREAQKGVHNGSRAFNNAQAAYDKTYVNWQRYQKKELDGSITPEEREAQKKDIQDAKKKIDAYLKRTADKDLDKNPKTKKRVQSMEKAKKNLDIRLQKIEIAEKKEKLAEAEAQKEINERRVEAHKRNLRSGDRLVKMGAKASLKADEKLKSLGDKQTLTRREMKQARKAIAAKILEERLKQPGQEKLKSLLAKNPKEYETAVKTIAESKEFKKSFPDSKLTPANCKILAENPKAVTREAKKFNRALIEKNMTKQQRKQAKQAEKQKKMEPPKAAAK